MSQLIWVEYYIFKSMKGKIGIPGKLVRANQNKSHGDLFIFVNQVW